MSDKRVLLATIGAPHGVSGEARVKTFTEDPSSVVSYGPLETADGRIVRIVSARALKGDMLVARFEGVGAREQAEALKGVDLFLPRDRLPETEDEDTFYHADLIGLDVVDEEGNPLGRVVDVLNYGAGDLLDVAPEGRRSGELIPFTRAFVPEVDLKAGRIVARRVVMEEGGEPSDPS